MFTVIEMQTNGETTAVLTYSYKDKNTAYQKFHTILAAAAVSSVEVHTAVILNEYGFIEATQYFDHRPDAE